MEEPGRRECAALERVLVVGRHEHLPLLPDDDEHRGVGEEGVQEVGDLLAVVAPCTRLSRQPLRRDDGSAPIASRVRDQRTDGVVGVATSKANGSGRTMMSPISCQSTWSKGAAANKKRCSHVSAPSDTRCESAPGAPSIPPCQPPIHDSGHLRPAGRGP